MEQERAPVPSQKISPEKAAAIAESLGVKFDGEQFRIETEFSTGKKVTHVVSGRDRVDGVPIEEYIKAVQKFYPTIEKGKDFDVVSFVEALKKEEAKNKKAAQR